MSNTSIHGSTINKRRRRATRILVAAVFAVTTSCGLLPKETDPIQIVLPEPPGITTDTTYPVERADLYNEVEASAVVTPVRSTSLYFTQSGRVTVLTVGPQAIVQAGELLAQLDISDLQYNLAQAELDLAINELQNRLASVQASSEVQQRIRELETEKQTLYRNRLQTLIGGATIRAPYTGIIDRVSAKLGDHAAEYDTVIEISDPSEVELQVRLSLTEYDEVLPGQRALVEVVRDDWREGVVIQTVHRNPSSDASISRDIYFARVELLEPESADLRVNSRLSARIVLDEQNDTLAIPIAALREFKQQTYVRVLEGDVRREIYVKTGLQTETKVEIIEGLEEGMLVIGR